MARPTTTEKATARSARSAAHPGGTRLGGVDLALAQDAQRFRAMAETARLDVDEEGSVRLVAAVQPVPAGLCRQLVALLAGDRRGVTRAVDAFVMVRA
jgi:hypothetical protein